MWRTPRRKAFTPTGITRGATVSGRGLRADVVGTRRITGQVWAQAPSTYKQRWWWVVANGVAYLCSERDLTVLGQCVDAPNNTNTNTAA